MMPSFMSKFSAFAIRSSGRKRLYANPVKRGKYVEKLNVKNAKPFKLPPFPYRSKPVKETFEGVETVIFNKGSKMKIIYLHGGAYCEPPLLPHFMLCDNVASKTDYEIIFPVYKKAPVHTFTETYEMLIKLYKSLLENNLPQNIVFMGDSSGGGLALSFCEYLKEIELPQPKRMILLSPWLDVSMSTPFSPEIDKVDPNLQYDFLKLAGENWAGDADPCDYRVSPIYGDLTDLAPITVYFGTHENLITDARIFRDKCSGLGVPLDYREWEGMNHVFVVYPIPEARKAQNEIIDLLKSDIKEF
ncbi:MAG: alpha/beta hydrolase [Eubacterium sp.]|nr:alpha/beta hydrolase [Eubacterium sp.]